jgi:hypothetical protein
MKKINSIYSLLLATTLFILSGCKEFLDVNVDPTLKEDATMQELLPTAQLYTSEVSYQQAYFACQYAQQLGSNLGITGTDSYAEAENATGWSNLYLYVIPQLNLLIQKGQAQKSPAYVGIAKTMMAYNLGVAAVNWENIPFSQADQKNFTPGYDTQQTIYTNIQKLLDEGITELGKSEGTKPGTDDMIYAGDLGKWTRLAYSLKAKFAMHLSGQNAQTAAQAAVAALQNGMKTNADDFQLQYNSKNLSPWYSRVALANSTSNLSVTYGSTFVDLLNCKTQGVVDPRLPIVVTLKNNQTVYQGVVPGSGAGSTVDFNTKAWHSSITSPIVMMTFAETKAIESEARFLLNGGTISSKGATPEAYAAYLDIAKANMQKLGVSTTNIDTYLASPLINIGASELTLKRVILEKYKAMFLMGDIWTDLRKYNYLDFPMPNNANPELGGKRIQRMKYPSSELTRNSKNAESNFKDPTTSMWIFTK